MLLKADLAFVGGRHKKGAGYLRKARETKISKQSSVLRHVIDMREQTWAVRRGEEGAAERLRELAAAAREAGYHGDARLGDRELS